MLTRDNLAAWRQAAFLKELATVQELVAVALDEVKAGRLARLTLDSDRIWGIEAPCVTRCGAWAPMTHLGYDADPGYQGPEWTAARCNACYWADRAEADA